jgi:hypothetical protein
VPRAYFAAFACMHLVFAVCFGSNLPYFPYHPHSGSQSLFFLSLGFMPLDVFNKTDLNLSAHWFTVRAVDKDGKEEIVPYLGPMGERLAWHQSDRPYFGNSSLWRRSKLNLGSVCYAPSDTRFLSDLFGWYRHRTTRSVAKYIVTYYYQPVPKVDNTAPYITIHDIAKVCEVEFDSQGRLQMHQLTHERPFHVGQPVSYSIKVRNRPDLCARKSSEIVFEGETCKADNGAVQVFWTSLTNMHAECAQHWPYRWTRKKNDESWNRRYLGSCGQRPDSFDALPNAFPEKALTRLPPITQ